LKTAGTLQNQRQVTERNLTATADLFYRIPESQIPGDIVGLLLNK
jgi:hypothetical protein